MDLVETDDERLQAEALALGLRKRFHPNGPGEFDVGRHERELRSLTDTALRDELKRLRGIERHLASLSSRSLAWHKTMSSLAQLYAGAFEETIAPDDLHEKLSERFGLIVAQDGLLEVDKITDDLKWVGSLPFALYHHTSSALFPVMRHEGLRIGPQTNFFNTQAGVYVSTIAGGQPVEVYSARAARVHGGEPSTIRVRRELSDLTPDPDDVDLAWAHGRQFVTPSVPPQDIYWDGGRYQPFAEGDDQPAPARQRAKP